MVLSFSAFTFVAAIAAIVGTERLGRPLTDDEKQRFGRLLREHDYPGARLIALRYAHQLTKARARAQELMGRADLRLVRFGWDPREVSLPSRLVRLVWSEWTHALGETEKAKRAEEAFLRQHAPSPSARAPSAEQAITERAADRDAEALAKAQLGKLRAAFEAAGDRTNLVWLDAAEAENRAPELPKLAAESGIAIEELRAAAKRRKRAVLRLLATERGVEWTDEA